MFGKFILVYFQEQKHNMSHFFGEKKKKVAKMWPYDPVVDSWSEKFVGLQFKSHKREVFQRSPETMDGLLQERAWSAENVQRAVIQLDENYVHFLNRVQVPSSW